MPTYRNDTDRRITFHESGIVTWYPGDIHELDYFVPYKWLGLTVISDEPKVLYDGLYRHGYKYVEAFPNQMLEAGVPGEDYVFELPYAETLEISIITTWPEVIPTHPPVRVAYLATVNAKADVPLTTADYETLWGVAPFVGDVVTLETPYEEVIAGETVTIDKGVLASINEDGALVWEWQSSATPAPNAYPTPWVKGEKIKLYTPSMYMQVGDCEEWIPLRYDIEHIFHYAYMYSQKLTFRGDGWAGIIVKAEPWVLAGTEKGKRRL